MQIELERLWTLGTRVGDGGFGAVFEASAADYEQAVAKLVPKEEGAHRELLFENLSSVRNVIPIVDSGEVDDQYVLIMPRADKSLRQHLANADRPLDVDECISVLVDITTALWDLDDKVVHRDLKPENILFYEGKWCIADFGISRYAEASTASDTRKYALSPHYAAPERWRDQRATAATDVYSLGVIAHELLSTSLPFSGDSRSDWREQHLYETPPTLSAVPSHLAILVQECLSKPAEARPRPSTILQRLQHIAEPPRLDGLAKLHKAHQDEVTRQTENETFRSRRQSEEKRRLELFDVATTQMTHILTTFKTEIVAAAPSVKDNRDIGSLRMQLGDATMELSPVVRTTTKSKNDLARLSFTVIGHSSISIQIPPDRWHYEGRSHSLWFCDAIEKDYFQWFEIAFMISPLLARSARQNPFACDPREATTAEALSVVHGTLEVAWPLTPLAVGAMDDFLDRWSSWLADGANGKLHSPQRMPERPINNGWRRH